MRSEIFLKFFTSALIWALISVLNPIFGQIEAGAVGEISSVVRSYTIAGIRTEGARYADNDVIIMIGGLKIGSRYTISGEEGAKAVRNLWKQGLFGDISIAIDSIIQDKIYLAYVLKEYPRLSRVTFNRKVSKGRAEEIIESLKGYKGRILTEEVRGNIDRIVKKYFINKGYFKVQVNNRIDPDTTMINSVNYAVQVILGPKVRLSQVLLEGNRIVSSRILLKQMKGTKPRVWWNPFRIGKWDPEKFNEDKLKLIKYYQRNGYRDARILTDSVFLTNENELAIQIKIWEGNPFFIRSINFSGNTIHPDSLLLELLGVKSGELYNKELIESRLQMDAAGRDISSLYMDDGYLFFQIDAQESSVIQDSVDLLVRINEGSQATIRNLKVQGNTKTSEHVIVREIRTRPGQKFSRSDVIRTTRELSQLGYFDPEQLGVVPTPNPQHGTVDIEYKVVERSNDQVELSGGWGAGQVVGSLGLVLNNFSARKLFDPKAWAPVPGGDGQRLSVRAQSNGRFFQSYNFSFTEPWLGGKAPNSLSVSAYVSIQNQAPLGAPKQSIVIRGASVSLGKRLRKPDDFFTLLHSLNIQQFDLNNNQTTFFFPNGISNNIFIKETLSRNSVDQPIFPRSGANVSLSAQITLPYSLIGREIKSGMSASERYKWMEYHKWRFDLTQYQRLLGNLVVMSRVQFGFLGSYNSIFGDVPFGRFYVGGDGIMGFNLDDRELIGLRGYGNNSLTPRDQFSGQFVGATAFQKYTMELRYPLSLNPSATIYVTSFLEAGNSFSKIKSFNPFYNYRSAGVGVRVFLPMFGLLGVDWGYGFDSVPGQSSANKGNVHISIGQSF